ncbi:MAG: hypothetical protein K8R90_09605 [Candidatus Cloacimonetes bacterium]|nr:hypothetical protein [Candidatus Cloacimonadota bacterium]
MKQAMVVGILLSVIVTLGTVESDLERLIEMYESGDWGYEELELDIGSVLSVDRTDRRYVTTSDDAGYPVVEKLERFGGNFELLYTRHQESEQHYLDMQINPSFSLDKSNIEKDDHYIFFENYYGYGFFEEYLRNYTGSIEINKIYRKYTSGDRFFSLAFDGGFDISGVKKRTNISYQEYDNAEINVPITLNLGGGTGRMRDVTNVVRAWRLAERLQEQNGTQLTDEQILTLARYLDRQPAYSAAFDWKNNAGDYHFWQDALSAIGLEQLNYDEFLYISQEAREGTILRRQQGLLIDFGVIGDLHLNTQEYDPEAYIVIGNDYYETNSIDQFSIAGGIFFSIESAKNTSSSEQKRVTVLAQVLMGKTTTRYDLDDYADELKYTDGTTTFSLEPGIEYLNQVSDRFGVTLSASALMLTQTTTSEMDDNDSNTSDHMLLGLDVGCQGTYFLGPVTMLVLDAGYNRLEYFNSDMEADSNKARDNWLISLQLTFRPLARMF